MRVRATCRQSGFTLIEIMLVLMIIAILALALLPNIVGSDRPARIVTTKTNLNTLRSQIQMFRTNENRYPKDDLSDLLTETYKDQGKEKHYLRKMPRELVSSKKGNNHVTNTLGTDGGWYYDTKSGEVYVNYNKELGDDWDLSDDDEKNPSKW